MSQVKSICVYCASSKEVHQEFLEMAADLGRRMARQGIDLVYGGASIGLMGAVARGVHQEGGRVVGVLPRFFMVEGIRYDEADELIVTEDMRDRKAEMDRRSDAFMVLPGGIGTLEEAMEILSMKQLKLTSKPLVFINTRKFYDGLIGNLREMVDLQFAKSESLDLFAVEPDPESALKYTLEYKPVEVHSKWM